MRHYSKRTALLRSAVTALLIILSMPTLPADAPAKDFVEQHREVPNAGFDELHVNLGADFARYRTVLIEEAPVSFVPRWVNVHRNAVSNRDIVRLRNHTADDLKAELIEKLTADGRYRIVETAELDTLLIRPEIINLNVASPGSGQHARLVDSPGYATLSLEMVDAFSGQTIVRLVDRRQARGPSGREYFLANPATNAREFRMMMAVWSERVRVQLDLLSASDHREIPSEN